MNVLNLLTGHPLHLKQQDSLCNVLTNIGLNDTVVQADPTTYLPLDFRRTCHNQNANGPFRAASPSRSTVEWHGIEFNLSAFNIRLIVLYCIITKLLEVSWIFDGVDEQWRWKFEQWQLVSCIINAARLNRDQIDCIVDWLSTKGHCILATRYNVFYTCYLSMR